ncbi:hypothetical protein AU381_25795 [Sinorhizobium glycinis]|uniref:Uncharacterized protein n=1 Tax=Sinorhizobium glycinis TaxID=1472378 RepID=A0A178XIV8_9HYPH|nr:hypothetical protein [Sinorhizobium glycinis]OAP35167.1 hypothetical protein AU381_25795 [Sinorhizobium glycinis]
MVQNMGTIVPAHANSRDMYIVAIAAALKEELGGGARAIKTIMRWTGASGRTARHWLAGDRGPEGWHLVLLARHSDQVMRAVLKMAERDLLSVSIELTTAEVALARATAIIKALHVDPRGS